MLSGITPPGKPLKKKIRWKIPKMKNRFCINVALVFEISQGKRNQKLNCKSGLTEKYFSATVFQSNIREKTTSSDTTSFRDFYKKIRRSNNKDEMGPKRDEIKVKKPAFDPPQRLLQML